jgi:predicted translin family RNA/ssDNA-binding protein
VEEALEKYFGRQLDQSLNDTTDQLQSNSKHLTGLPEVLAISFNTFDLESRLATSAGQEVDEVIQMAKYVKSDQISERDELSISAVISFEGGTTLGTGSFVTYMYRGSKLYKMG